MIDFGFPTTRFLGSKSKLLPWMYQNLVGLQFDNVLDVFGGTASISYMFKALGKEVYFNDILKFNQDIGTALIENKSIKITKNDIKEVLKPRIYKNKRLIESNFKNIYFKDSENRWLDQTVQNIHSLKNKYKRSILLSALYQACLMKRPYNLFHRKNLYMRTNTDVDRSFGNKTSWDKPFRIHFLRFINEFNTAVLDNGRENKVMGGYDALAIPNKRYDLVYLDPPYISKKSSVNYLDCYHFLEGLSRYNEWEKHIDYNSNNRKMINLVDVDKFINKERVSALFSKLFYKFRNSHIVMSYRNDGIPSIPQIKDALKDATGKDPKISSFEYKYALSNGSSKEILLITE
jgi:adenine-specific DNA-methyltransferase